MTLLEPPPHQHISGGSDGPAPRSLASRITRSPLGIGLMGAVAVLLVDAGGTDDGPGLCVFRRCTGGYCPGCGVTRSAKHLTRGELGAAWHDHPWLVLVAAQMLVAGAVLAVFRSVRERINWSRAVLIVGGANVALIVGIWIVRLIDGSIPRFF